MEGASEIPYVPSQSITLPLTLCVMSFMFHVYIFLLWAFMMRIVSIFSMREPSFRSEMPWRRLRP